MSVFTLVADDARKWVSTLTDFDKVFGSVTSNVAALKKIGALPPALEAKRSALLSTGLSVQSRLQGLLDTRNKVVAWLKSWLPSSEAKQLGAIPLVAIAVGIVAFVAAIAAARSFLGDVADFAEQYKVYQAEQERLVSQGVDPKRAAEIARSTASGLAASSGRPGLSDLIEKLGGKAIVVGGLVVLGVIILPKIAERMGRGR